MYVCVSKSKKCFFEKLSVICFLVTSVLRFALLPYYRRIDVFYMSCKGYYSRKVQNLIL